MRSLSPDEAALWARVMESVRPIRPTAPPPASPNFSDLTGLRKARALARPASSVPAPVAAKPSRPGTTLDAGWDRKLARGTVIPDVTVDLHGHTLHSAHDLLEGALSRSIARGDRVILLVTGKPPRPESERPHARGAIRAAVGDWLAGSRFAANIAAVRGASPRHGGAGALYIVLRREREAKS